MHAVKGLEIHYLQIVLHREFLQLKVKRHRSEYFENLLRLNPSPTLRRRLWSKRREAFPARLRKLFLLACRPCTRCAESTSSIPRRDARDRRPVSACTGYRSAQ